MPRRRPERARRRIHERTLKNAAAKGVEIALPDENQPRRVRHRDQLEFLEIRKAIDAKQRAGGEQLRRDWVAAGRSPKLTARYDGLPVAAYRVGPRDDVGNLAAAGRLRAALEAIGSQLAPIAIHICLCELPPGEWARANGKPNPDGPALLRAALDGLVGHYAQRRRMAA